MIKQVVIQEQVIQKIMKSCFPVPPEMGGYIGKKDDIICEFEFDPGIAQINEGIYIPNVIKLNAVMKRWSENGISFCGILHTHLPGQNELSEKDKRFISDIMKLNKRLFEKLYFPIVIPESGLFLYQAERKADKVKIESVNFGVERKT